MTHNICFCEEIYYHNICFGREIKKYQKRAKYQYFLVEKSAFSGAMEVQCLPVRIDISLNVG